jgi:hypothetical protein
MSFYWRRFNLYFWPAALLLVSGCALWKHENPTMASVRVHMEGSSGSPESTETIQIIRSAPVMVTIAKMPILSESDLAAAAIVQTPGGFAVELKFDEIGGWKLEQYTAVNPGKHLVIFGQWGDQLKDGRWLAAPSIYRRIAGGVLIFTPDASREEAEKFVAGLNAFAKKNNGSDKRKE